MRISDLSSDNSGAVLLIYGYDDDDDDFINDRSRDAYDTCHTGWCNGKWNREHVFARSLSNPPLTTTDPGPGTDIHNLRAADSQKNSERSNRFFADGSGNSGIIEGGLYFPGDEWKGDVARIIMYMYLRYPGQCNAVNSAAGPITYAIQNDMPDLLLEWNQEDPVSDFELTRNDVIYYYQGNRNPFIDNPYLASLIWNGPQAVDAWETLSGPDYDAQPVTVYPNVTDDYITISGLGSKEFKTTIYNQLGQAVFNNNNQKSINVSKLPAGVYILEVRSSQQLSPFKFIKN
jgi:endonuclease I